MVDRVGVHDRRDRVVEVEVLVAEQRAAGRAARAGAGERARREDHARRSSGMRSTTPRAHAIRGCDSIASVMRRAKATRSTASALPAGTAVSSAAAHHERAEAPHLLLEQTHGVAEAGSRAASCCTRAPRSRARCAPARTAAGFISWSDDVEAAARGLPRRLAARETRARRRRHPAHPSPADATAIPASPAAPTCCLCGERAIIAHAPLAAIRRAAGRRAPRESRPASSSSSSASASCCGRQREAARELVALRRGPLERGRIAAPASLARGDTAAIGDGSRRGSSRRPPRRSTPSTSSGSSATWAPSRSRRFEPAQAARAERTGQREDVDALLGRVAPSSRACRCARAPRSRRSASASPLIRRLRSGKCARARRRPGRELRQQRALRARCGSRARGAPPGRRDRGRRPAPRRCARRPRARPRAPPRRCRARAPRSRRDPRARALRENSRASRSPCCVGAREPTIAMPGARAAPPRRPARAAAARDPRGARGAAGRPASRTAGRRARTRRRQASAASRSRSRAGGEPARAQGARRRSPRRLQQRGRPDRGGKHSARWSASQGRKARASAGSAGSSRVGEAKPGAPRDRGAPWIALARAAGYSCAPRKWSPSDSSVLVCATYATAVFGSVFTTSSCATTRSGTRTRSSRVASLARIRLAIDLERAADLESLERCRGSGRRNPACPSPCACWRRS